MTFTRTGYAPTLNNVSTVLTHDPLWKGVLAYDSFKQRCVVLRPPPYAGEDYAVKWSPGERSREVTNTDASNTNTWMERQYRIRVSSKLCNEAIEQVARTNAYHPVREYLSGLKWDGIERLPTWLSTYMGAKQSRFTQDVGQWWMISAIARVMKPGEGAEYMLILEGSGGLQKSSALRVLGGDWFTDQPGPIDNKEGQQQLAGVWIVEHPELLALAKRGHDAMKSYLSIRVDHYRPPYGHRAEDFPRQCVFAGSTNEAEYLPDLTGNRRYWPVLCGFVNLEALRRDRDQLWAEARERWAGGMLWYPTTLQEHDTAAAEQELRTPPDSWESLIAEWLAGERVRVRLGGFVPLPVINEEALKIPKEKMGRQVDMRVSGILKRLGWVRVRRGGQWGYVRAEEADLPEVRLCVASSRPFPKNRPKTFSEI